MLTGTIDASEWLLMKQALEAVLSGCSLHDLHCELASMVPVSITTGLSQQTQV